jgi:hypothetical protein
MLDELAVNGSGAATLDSFYSERENQKAHNNKSMSPYLLTLLADHL